MFKTGYHRDPPDVVRRRGRLHLLAGRVPTLRATLGNVPLATSNRAKLSTAAKGPGILNQGLTESCVGHSEAGKITLRMNLMGTPIALVSPIGCYAVSLMIDRLPNADGSLDPLVDQGTEPSQCVRGVQEWGITSAQVWGNYPADPATIANEPRPEQLQADAEFLLQGEYFLSSTGDAFIADMIRVLAAGMPFTAALNGSAQSFQGYRGGILDALVGPPDHQIYVVDYAWDGQNLDSFVGIGANSWGEVSWGESDSLAAVNGGLFRFNRAQAQLLQDCAVSDLRPPTSTPPEWA